MGLLQTLCLVKMDSVDGNKHAGAAGKQDPVKTNAADCTSSPTAEDNESKMETEMKGECREAGQDKILFSLI